MELLQRLIAVAFGLVLVAGPILTLWAMNKWIERLQTPTEKAETERYIRDESYW
jgi:hypothetical protein